jgi:hypothetical protein
MKGEALQGIYRRKISFGPLIFFFDRALNRH